MVKSTERHTSDRNFDGSKEHTVFLNSASSPSSSQAVLLGSRGSQSGIGSSLIGYPTLLAQRISFLSLLKGTLCELARLAEDRATVSTHCSSRIEEQARE